MKSENGTARRRPVGQHLAVVSIALGLLSRPVAASVHVPTGVRAPSAATESSAASSWTSGNRLSPARRSWPSRYGQPCRRLSQAGRCRFRCAPADPRQRRSDRYYAAHLLGDLRDARAVPILVPLLKDEEVKAIVPWALGQIGDASAIGPLLEALDEDNPSMRVLAIYALETLSAREALLRLISLLDDRRKSNFGAQVSVAEAAEAAIARLR